MKKTLIAVAALAATGAFAQVTVTGVLDAGYNVTSRSAGVAGIGTTATTLASSSGVAQNGSATTAIVITGTEDLGGGMKAGFRYEMNPDFVGGDGLSAAGSRNGYNSVSLSGSFGLVEFGRINTATLAANGIANPFGTNVGGAYGAMTSFYRFYNLGDPVTQGTAPTRFNNSLKYATPNLSGFTGQIIYVPKVDDSLTGATTDRQGVTELGLGYVNGPLAVQFAQQVVEAAAPSTSTTSTLAAGEKSTLNTLAASYQITKDFKLAGAYITHTIDNNKADATGLRLSGTYTMGKTVLMASWANMDDKRTADEDRSVLGFGVDYNLSSKTALYLRYEALEQNKAATVDTKVTQTMAGLRVRF